MGRKTLTTSEVIEQFKAVHGDRYLYTLVEYINTRTNIKIICPKHGIFKQQPHVHKGGSGCPECGGNKTLTTSEVIEQFKALHGDRYDYTLVEHIHSHRKVKIICPEHGVFEQTPNVHKGGSGCPECGLMGRKLVKIEVIEQFKALHGDRYDYTLVEHIHSHRKVKIICPEHGVFKQTPYLHKNCNGCFKCGVRNRTSTKTEVLEQFKVVHGNKYNYALVEYINNRTNIKIICPKHGVFKQQPRVHKGGNGCPECGNKTLTKTEVLEQFKVVHGNKYNYALVEYINTRTKVKIICPEHGVFEQTPTGHKNGNGCFKCNHTSDNNVLYIWEAIGERWNDVPIFKVGVTSLRLGTQRIRQVASKHGLKYKLHLLIEVSGESATSLENRIHRKLSVIPKMEGDGATEFRACSDEEMEQIIDMIKFDEELEKEVQ